MALQLDDATAIINRTTNLVAASSDYCCCFWYQPTFVSTTPDYIAPFVVTNSGYTAWAGILGNASVSTGATRVSANAGGGASVTTSHNIIANRKIHLGYRRSGTSHFFYVNGQLVGSVTLSIAAVTFAEMLLGNDRSSVVSGPLVFWDFKEWNASKSAGTIQREMRTIGSVDSTTSLVAYTPLVSTLNDTSGNGNHWGGAGNYSFVSQPTLPSNLTPATALSLPFGLTAQTTTQSLDASAVTMTVWYVYENTSGRDQVISIGHWGDVTATGSGYNPHCDGWVDITLNNTNIYDGFVNGSGTFPLPAGMTIWFEFNPDSVLLTPTDPATLFIKTLLGPEGDAQIGDIFIRTASFSGGPDLDEVPEYTGLHGGFVRTEQSDIIGYVALFPTGESGDVLPTSGRMLFSDDGGSWDGYTTLNGDFAYWCYLYEPDFSIVTRFAWPSNFLAPGPNRTHLQTEKFYMLGYHTGTGIDGNPGNGSIYAPVDANGTLGTIRKISTTAAGGLISAIAADASETYLLCGGPTGALKRWNLSTLAFTTDLAAAVANYSITDILVMDDETIVVCYYDGIAPTDVFVRRYNDAGTLLNTYTFTFSATLVAGVTPRLAYASDTGAFWIFNHLTTHYSDIRKIRMSDGAELVASLTPDTTMSSVAQADPPLPYTSDSCPILELRVASGSPASPGSPLEEGIIGPLVWVEWSRRVAS